MKKLSIVILLCLTLLNILCLVHGSLQDDPKQVELWFKNLAFTKRKMTKLHFYFHDNAQAEPITAVQVAHSNNTFHSPSLFGLVMMVDAPITIGPKPTSKLVGRAQGFYGFSDQQERGLLMTLNLVFTEGKYNGSTLSILGRNPVMHAHREMSIVGGSGVFRLSQGIATATTYYYDGMNAVVEFNVVVLHY
ncbi:Dirigent protein [Heracleum sosnowskyi]|uniref:Dirigent protein n=1 Tax=Heracleum sosnowskyi TaxID=360622 RepID=A0AAD8N376_9APIA|nr:Dirigent protein [Heracleum sosnowskyi]